MKIHFKFRCFVLIATALMASGCADREALKLQSASPIPQELTNEKELSDTYEAKGNNEASDLYTPLNYENQISAWISYIELADMLSDDEEEFRQNVLNMFEQLSETGCNTVYVHVRAFSDSLFESEYYALSKYLPTKNGEPCYDPLEIMTDCAHELSLSFHAWINPLRCESEEYIEASSDTLIYKWYKNSDSYDEYISLIDGHFWLNPCKSEVRELICDGVREIAQNYEIDGVVIDDYFYPTTLESFDESSYAESGGNLSLEEWRLENCSLLVSEMYSALKAENESLLFGVSPSGNIDNNYSVSYADVRLWCSEDGYLDYIAPQIYFGYENQVCPFLQTLEEWRELVTNENVKLVCALAVYKLEQENEYIENTGIIAEQISDAFESGCDGISLYSVAWLISDEQRLAQEREAVKLELSERIY